MRGGKPYDLTGETLLRRCLINPFLCECMFDARTHSFLRRSSTPESPVAATLTLAHALVLLLPLGLLFLHCHQALLRTTTCVSGIRPWVVRSF